MVNKEQRLNVYILDSYLNEDLTKYLKSKYNVLNCEYLNGISIDKNSLLKRVDVLIVSNVDNLAEGFEIVDYILSMGKEIICIIDRRDKNYLAYHLIRDGAINI